MEWKNLKEALETYGQVLEDTYREELADADAFSSGRLFDSIKHIVEIGDHTMELCLSLEDYWKYVEEGRKAGKFPPLGNIEDWIRVKPISPYPDAKGRVPSNEQLAFLIGRKIAKEGIKGKYPLEKSLRSTEDWIKLIEDAIELDVKAELNSLI